MEQISGLNVSIQEKHFENLNLNNSLLEKNSNINYIQREMENILTQKRDIVIFLNIIFEYLSLKEYYFKGTSKNHN